MPATPPGTVPALKHYRLVYESSPDAATSVKVFEYVEGAVIPGEGVIEVTVVTNTGREFVYRQTSENGTFVVPYSTTGNPYDLKTTGNYRMVGGTGELTATEGGGRDARIVAPLTQRSRRSAVAFVATGRTRPVSNPAMTTAIRSGPGRN